MIEPIQKIRLLAGTVILYIITAVWLSSSINKQAIQAPYHINTSKSINFQIGIDPTPAPPIPPPIMLKN